MLRIIDLFAGCGGLTEGFLSDRFEIVAHVEWDRHAIHVLKHRLQQINPCHPDDVVMQFDIQRTDEMINGFEEDEKFGSHPGLDYLVNNRKIDVVIGGPPCQAYSIAGRIRDENGMQDDYRNYLFESFVEVLERYKPKVFVFENVVGMLSAAPGGIPIVERIRKAFDDAGYRTISDYKQAVFDMSEYGVPQRRRRVIIVGLREDSFDEPDIMLEKFYSKDDSNGVIPKRPMITIQDAIGDLPEFFPLKKPIRTKGRKLSHQGVTNGVTQHESRFHNSRDIETFRMLTEDLRDGTNLYNSIEAIKNLYTERTGKSANVHKYHVIRPDQPGNTIPAHLYKDGLRHIHWDPAQCRTITVREAACIQGFPRDFEYPVSMGAAYKMIGNAVPPTFSQLLADGIFELISE
jgi:DNA (cytosine-5)-methyltransferase 1